MRSKVDATALTTSGTGVAATHSATFDVVALKRVPLANGRHFEPSSQAVVLLTLKLAALADLVHSENSALLVAINSTTCLRTVVAAVRTAATTVRRQVVLLMATSKAEFSEWTRSASAASFRVNSTTACEDGSKCLPLASGTRLSATTSKVAECVAATPVPEVVSAVASTLDRNAQLGSFHSVLLTPADGKTCSGKTLSITATSPSGVVSMGNYTIP